MGNRASSTICYGIKFESEYPFPWMDEESDFDDIDDWWLYEVCKYTPLFEIYNEDGEYIDGIKPDEEKVNEYWDNLRKFEKENPIPIELIYGGTSDYPDFVIGISLVGGEFYYRFLLFFCYS